MENGNGIPPSFALQLNAATRAEHTRLNKLILARLPLCLPPASADPSTYTAGISAFANIYFAFEQEWRGILLARNGPPPLDTHGAQQDIFSLLGSLHQQGLDRTERLKSDLDTLSKRLEATSISQHATILGTQYFSATQGAISASIKDKPHVILAYSWVMYMALFNGGRWIRQQMLNAGADFWLAPRPSKDYASEDYGCLSLWFFDPSTSDGEDMKLTFKAKFEEVAAQLDDKARADIIEEAIKLFRLCSETVEALDRTMLEMNSAPSNAKVMSKESRSPFADLPIRLATRRKDTDTIILIIATVILLFALWTAYSYSPSSWNLSFLENDW